MTDAEKKMINETLNGTDWDALAKAIDVAGIKWPVIGSDAEAPPAWRVQGLALELMKDAVEHKSVAAYPGLCARYDIEEKVLELMLAMPVSITYLAE